MKYPSIEELIPHRFPFLFIDEIVSYENDVLTCLKTFHADEPFFQGHYPDFPIVPGVILCETAMQAGAALLVLSERIKKINGQVEAMPVVAKMGEARFRQIIRPEDALVIAVNVQDKMNDIFFLKAKITKDGKTVLQLEFACALTPVSKHNG